MNTSSRRFKTVDILLLLLTLLPLVGGMVLKVCLIPVSDGIEISGAHIFFTISMPGQDLPITEAQVNSWLVLLSLLFLCLYLTHGLSANHPTKRQHVAEMIIEKTEFLVSENMGRYFSGFAPFIAAILGLSACSSLLTLIGLFPPTSDLNVVAGWAIGVFCLITYYKFKCGFGHYLKSFAEPVAFLTPLNVVSEFATPISMAFRHYGNILSGMVISILVSAGLQGLSSKLLGWIPGAAGHFPLFQIGLPALLSVYFDVFSGCLQAFIFAMLTMLYISGAFPEEEYEKRLEKRRQKTKNKKKN